MKILIVHAHHEPQSFCSALSKRAKSEFEKNGHEVIFSDLHAMNFDPVSDRRNFSTVKDSNYLKQQQEEMYASENSGFANDLNEEMKKLENGLAMSQKPAMVITTTGGGPNAYDGWGLNPAIETLLLPIQHGIFWFNGFLPLEPFVAWSVARMSDAERKNCLEQLAKKIGTFFEEKPAQFPHLADFPNWGSDSKNRYQVVVRRNAPVDDKYMSLVQEEIKIISELKREGVLTDFQMSAPDDTQWRAFLKMRCADELEVKQHLARLPLAAFFDFEITRIVPANQAVMALQSH